MSDVIWNFEKFLVSAQGVPLFRFLPFVEPLKLEPLISLLSSPPHNQTSQEEQLVKMLAHIDDVTNKRMDM